VLNEEALIGMLQQYGFQTVLLSKLSFAEQVALFASAKIIVAAHGAGLANLSFCNEGTHLIEIFSEHYIKPTYQIICKRRNIKYTYFAYPSENDHQPATLLEANKSNIMVNIEEVEAKINEYMPHTAPPDNALTFL
jgi:capsular polysaccharide biosynthesis protein